MLATLTATATVAPARAEYSDCRTCHYATAIESTAPDLTNYFMQPGHHPVRVSYPLRADYHQPLGAQTNILFFDRNGNGVADKDEIQIFNSTVTTSSGTSVKTRGTKGGGGPKGTADPITWIIDCASCHAEHGTMPPDPTRSADYVRGAGGDRMLCSTCHNL